VSTSSPIRAQWKGEYRERHDEDGNVVERMPLESLPGIPARDLTEDEYQALSVDQRAEVRGSALYDTKTDAEMKPAIRRAEKAVERAVEQSAQSTVSDGAEVRE
jgi:hypothetical protein